MELPVIFKRIWTNSVERLSRLSKGTCMRLRLELDRKIFWVCVIAIFFAGCRLHAQDVAGNWQGTITPPQGAPRRMVLQVLHDDSGALKARIYSIDQSPTGDRSEEHTSELQSPMYLVCRLLLE